ncbi:MAG: hypothetical protein MJK10_18015, partial [Pseudomonadales bacterium]|nr:hypothetical protein [Pseudomonadales bacterium]NRA18028.1 hypothetical protein [Oceanospirillaceae bacterium]
ATVEEATVEEATVEEATVEEATVEEATVEEASVEEEAVEEATAAETAEEVFVVEEKEASAESEIEQAASVSVATEGSVQQVKEESEQRINCVIVLMYGLKLAIPFENIEGMIKLSNVSLSLDNDRNWILGDFTSATMRTHVVDTAQILFGENYDPLKSNYNEMLVLAGKHWSIVFDKIIKAQSILISDVTENPSPQFRPWLTGTYMAEKCALVNVPAMVKMFEEELNG